MYAMKDRLRTTLSSSNPLQRLWEFAFRALLYRLPVSWRKQLYKGEQYYCPICSNRVRKFLVLVRKAHAYCPVCQSLQRDRFAWFLIQQQGLINEDHNKVLHIAPEKCLRERFEEIPTLKYVSVDLHASAAMLQMDVTALDFPENTFDLVYCSHVLEHVPDDHKAIAEIRRVLKNGAHAMILIPIMAEHTFEDATITDPLERERVFGQYDHVRAYGPDFAERLENAGFHCHMCKVEDIVPEEQIERQGLTRDEVVFLCEK